MENILKKLDSEKRNRIINSAIDEFSKYPYNIASTNTIVKNAEISKGLLFHYFGSKKALYEYLCEFVIQKLFNEINENLNWEESDIFERIKQITLIKLKISHIYPKLFEFVISIFKNTNSSFNTKDAISIYEKYGINMQEVFAKFYHHNIDYSLFKEQTNIPEKINIIRWTIEKFAEEETAIMMNSNNKFEFEKIIIVMDSYVDILKKAFY